jgi:hypothetical protein
MIKFTREFKITTRAKTAQQLPDLFLTIKFIYFEKATKFCEIFTYVVPVKSKEKISQNFVAFSEYMNFITKFIIREFIKNF